ncbi:MAG: BBE domain-containing protein [Acidimicrobiales bacterium]
MALLGSVTPDAGAYVNEADYFQPDWARCFWRDNYPRLLRIKERYDPPCSGSTTVSGAMAGRPDARAPGRAPVRRAR